MSLANRFRGAVEIDDTWVGGTQAHATAGGRSSYFAHGARRHGVLSTVGNGIAFRGGRTESGGSVGDAGLVLNCATLRKVAIYAPANCSALSETCHF